MARLALLLPLLLCGCPAAPGGHEDFSAPIDAAAGAEDLAGCRPGCGGLTPKCNAAGHCVGCLADADCAMGSYCKIISDAIASCAPGCTSDANCANAQKCCGNQCIDPMADARHCGGCDMACAGAHSAS